MGRDGFLKNMRNDLPKLKERMREASLRHSRGNVRIKGVHGFTNSDIRKMEYNLKHLILIHRIN